MCGSIVNIESASAEHRWGKRRKKEERRQKPQLQTLTITVGIVDLRNSGPVPNLAHLLSPDFLLGSGRFPWRSRIGIDGMWPAVQMWLVAAPLVLTTKRCDNYIVYESTIIMGLQATAHLRRANLPRLSLSASTHSVACKRWTVWLVPWTFGILNIFRVRYVTLHLVQWGSLCPRHLSRKSNI